MRERKPKCPILDAMRDACADEARAVEFLEARRWGDSPRCPRDGCRSTAVKRMKDRTTGGRERHYRWRCKSCNRMFSVRTGTTFEESRLKLKVWVYAIWRASSSKKGCSALELSRQMEITHKSALFVLRRIRHGMGVVTAPPLNGTLEADV